MYNKKVAPLSAFSTVSLSFISVPDSKEVHSQDFFPHLKMPLKKFFASGVYIGFVVCLTIFTDVFTYGVIVRSIATHA